MLRQTGTVMLMLCCAAVAGADQGKGFGIRIGAAAITDIETNVRADARNRTRGTQLDFEENLGLDDSDTVFRMDGYFRFAGRHYIDAGYFDISRSATRTIDREIRFRDQTYPLSTRVHTTVDTRIIKVSYRYSFLRRDNYEFGASAGVHDMDIEVDLNADSLAISSNADARAPLPVIGLRGRITPVPRLHLDGSLEVFDVDVGDLDGTVADIRAGIEHDTFDHLGFGIGYNYFSLDAKADARNLSGEIDYSYQGLLVYAKGYF